MRLKAEEEGGALLLAANLECASELSTGKSFNMCCWTAWRSPHHFHKHLW